MPSKAFYEAILKTIPLYLKNHFKTYIFQNVNIVETHISLNMNFLFILTA